MNPSAIGDWKERQNRNRGRRAFIARTSYSGQEVVSRPRNAWLGRGEEGRKGERERERERESDFGRRSYFWIPLLFALLLTDSVMPALPARQDLLSQGVQVYKSQTRPQSPTGSWFLVIQAGSPLPPSLREPYQVPNTHTIILVPSSSASMCRGAHRRAAKWQLEKQRALPPFLPSSTRFKILSPRVKKAHSPPILLSWPLSVWDCG